MRSFLSLYRAHVRDGWVSTSRLSVSLLSLMRSLLPLSFMAALFLQLLFASLSMLKSLGQLCSLLSILLCLCSTHTEAGFFPAAGSGKTNFLLSQNRKDTSFNRLTRNRIVSPWFSPIVSLHSLRGGGESENINDINDVNWNNCGDKIDKQGYEEIDRVIDTETTKATAIVARAEANFHIHVDWEPLHTLMSDGDEIVVIVLMDAFCSYHGQYVAQQVLSTHPGVAVVQVCSNYLAEYILATKGEIDGERMIVPRIPNNPNEAEAWINDLRQKLQIVGSDGIRIRIRALYCESDSGLDDAEKMRELLQVECSDSPTRCEWRRNKHLMHQRVMDVMEGKSYTRTNTNDNNQNKEKNDVNDHSDSNLSAVVAVPRQRLCSTLDEAIKFARDEFDNSSGSWDSVNKAYSKVIVKPVRGVGSDSVFLCETLEEIQNAFSAITSSTVLGAADTFHKGVLVQEYVTGIEYAIDIVSHNGTHKVAALWRYDKRPGGSRKDGSGAFCYYRTELIDCEEAGITAAISIAARKTLDALGIRWGLSHSEFIIPVGGANDDDSAPVLIEVNCRQHNMDFAPIVMACIGYNAFDMMIDSWFSRINDVAMEFDSRYPNEPKLRAHGCMVHLVNTNNRSGELLKVRYVYDEDDCDDISIPSLESFFDMELYEAYHVGDRVSVVHPTIDIKTDAGWVQLIHPDEEVLQRDSETIVDRLMPTMFQLVPEDNNSDTDLEKN